MKKRNKKGFTLIDLLAVIVILAIIALIAMPIVMNLINKARKSAAEDSAYGIISASKNYYAKMLLEKPEGIPEQVIFICTTEGCKTNEDKKLDFKGTIPSNGSITISANGKIVLTDLIINNYKCNYKKNSDEIECYGKGEGPTTTTTTKPIVVGQNFSTDSWETIIDAVKSGDASAYKVGDTKTITVGSLGTHTVRIANITPCNGNLQSETACGFVIEFADIIREYKMNSSNTNVGGWEKSLMRTYLNTTVYNLLPSDLQKGIIDTTVISGHGQTAGEANFKTTDKLYLLSSAEVWSGGDSKDTARASTITRQLDYYKGVTTSSYAKAKKKRGTSYDYWWLRNAYSGNSTYFSRVGDTGRNLSFYGGRDMGVSPAFKLEQKK